MGDEKRPHCPTEKKNGEFSGEAGARWININIKTILHCFAIIDRNLSPFSCVPEIGRALPGADFWPGGWERTSWQVRMVAEISWINTNNIKTILHCFAIITRGVGGFVVDSNIQRGGTPTLKAEIEKVDWDNSSCPAQGGCRA